MISSLTTGSTSRVNAEANRSAKNLDGPIFRLTKTAAKRFVAQVIDAGEYTATIVPILIGLPDPTEIGNTLSDFTCEPVNVQLTETADNALAGLFDRFIASHPGALA